ncbi:bifunctional diaminohydroxyphosphoribosylaminopyrimidine deaminase/5-amino-6-(5-phosphoribosylamino)uracil reductase RibD [Leptospira stimsonii]|uniref:Bifunctional diaminohydroxyphosphoribosylaminopyrimidine deaminase/5-amino-6-(5-phosphoribosylamino)uracil reductase n=1 Tax=Leptospira stimsonii TaxID=2202203 RepID=A0A396YST1_9LEPT|nr:bifunctional diaminohydroxyphosphoribosylaminopyrimidine deaminase/5-amino-6-(5-phosphoribosylamino)uracil reductase [Leptospira stimsonii]RHX85635.1 bifunctional diaminohydroxyphosphoribosylaminopyrimidine deaminase/5-amino-6-(5-phosphoribosylamino)uracil reductase [Leptospira stimsonii]
MSSLPESFREELRKLAFLSTGESSPNPPVSCLITNVENTKIFAQGRTSPTGGPHAERNAYSEFLKNGYSDTPHNVWVTLEPCSHHGKTPPCLDLIFEYRPKTLYYGWNDPNPLVKIKNGLEECVEKGINVVQDSTLQTIAKESLFGFASRLETQTPSMIFKTAVSKEGFFASSDKRRTQLSGKLSSYYSSLLRAKCDAVLVGPGTLFHDVPGLDFRFSKLGSTESMKNLTKEFQKTEGLPVQEFQENFSGASALLKNILKLGMDSDIQRIHEVFENAYQPYRVFIIFEERNVTKEFLEKQKGINRRIGSRKCIFLIKKDFLLGEEIKEELRALSEKELFLIDSNFLAEETLRILSEIGVNLLLVEGGNLIYETFQSRMKANDTILKIRTATSIQEGIEPNLKTDESSLLWKANLEEDQWEAHRCLQDS